MSYSKFLTVVNKPEVPVFFSSKCIRWPVEKWYYKGPHHFETTSMLLFLLTNLHMKKVSISFKRKKRTMFYVSVYR